MNELPKLQSFAWNLGTRLEEIPRSRSQLFNLVTRSDVEKFSEVYFTKLHPIFGFLDDEDFKTQAARYWTSQEIDIGFEVVLCGVLALGSLYSPTEQLLCEAEIVELGRLALDHTFAHSGTRLSVDQVAGWILRALYLRTTGKPHLSWMASNMAMHIAESIGLHQEMGEMKTTHHPPRFVTSAEIEIRRKTFWVAASLNRYCAVHYGRTPIKLPNIGCHYPKSAGGANTVVDFVELVRLLPPPSLNVPSMTDLPELTKGLAILSRVRVESLPLLLLRMEMCFCVHRKIRFLGIVPAPTYLQMLLSMVRSALEAAKTLCDQREHWWSIVAVPFQALCVLLSIDSLESLSLIPEAMETLQTVSCIFDGHSTREAFQVAQSLVRASELKKRRELEYINQCLNLATGIAGYVEAQDDTSENMSDLQSFEWPTNLDISWSGFLDLPNSADMVGITSDLSHPYVPNWA